MSVASTERPEGPRKSCQVLAPFSQIFQLKILQKDFAQQRDIHETLRQRHRLASWWMMSAVRIPLLSVVVVAPHCVMAVPDIHPVGVPRGGLSTVKISERFGKSIQDHSTILFIPIFKYMSY